jgi:arylsulfatase A-like enzyme
MKHQNTFKEIGNCQAKTKRNFLLIPLLTLFLIGCESKPEKKVDERPNIIVFLIDDTGYADLGSYGSEISTPNLDKLASGGIHFTNYHTAATCSPTRSMLLTGVDNHLTGMGNMIEIMADNQFDQPGYEGIMSGDVVTLPMLLKDAGYNTYMAGKWHLGKTKESLPAARGFTRSIALMESGADNWEHKTYLPMYDYVHFYEGYEETDLPDDFFSSDYYIKRITEYIDEDHSEERKPFFAYVSYQAQHYPHQAPQKYIDKYMDMYDVGWDEIREQRYAKQVEMGIMPAGLNMQPNPIAPPWETLSEEERKVQAKKMAIYAGMLENLDDGVGRLISHLEEIGEADNTVIIFASDNGADNNEQDKVFKDWYEQNFDLSYEQMGLKGSYVNYGPGWAGASGTPLYMFKGSAAEGGMRVPFIVSGPGFQKGVATDAFAYVSDVTPTLLELAGVPHPEGSYKGRDVHSIMGKSMLSFLKGESNVVHESDDPVAYELAGSAAVFLGKFKLTKNNPPFGDKKWRLFNIHEDPIEANDLSEQEPEILATMMASYKQYAEDVKLIEVPEDYNPVLQVQKNVAKNQVEEITDKVPVTIE